MMKGLSKIRWSYLFANVFKDAEYEDYEGLPITIEGEEQLKQRCKQHASALQTDRKRFQTMMIINFLTTPLKYALPPTTDGTTDPSTSPYAYTLEKYYISSHVNKTYKKEVTTIFKKVKRTVLKSIQKYNWLNEDQKIILSNKIEKIKIDAFYTSVSDSERKEDISMIYRFPMKENDYYGNVFNIVKSKFLDVMRSILFNFDVSLSPLPTIMPNLIYIEQENRVFVNPGWMQPPFYIDGGDTASKYGSLGFFISHEIFHAIDITGVRFDAKGNLQNTEYFEALSNTILAKTDCFQEQYGRDPTAKQKIKKADFLDEIIADNGALHASFKTYKKLLKKLAGYVNQNPETTRKLDQSYFLRFAQLSISSQWSSNLDVFIKRKLHIKLVNIPLSNSKKFAKAYNCPYGSLMNPPKRCKVYLT
ncbi:Neprilysin-4 [Schistosoma japonicum]|nr:Neprilysin-4 [Schistosoma japonicum]